MNGIQAAVRRGDILLTVDVQQATVDSDRNTMNNIPTSWKPDRQPSLLTDVFRKMRSSTSGDQTFWTSLCRPCQLDSVDGFKSRPLEGSGAWDISGPVLAHWNEQLIHAVHVIFQQHKREILQGTAWELAIDCWMIGPSQHEARPNIVLACLDKGTVKRFTNKIMQDTTFKKSGFRVIGRRGSLRFLGVQDSSSQRLPTYDVPIDPCGLYVDIINNSERTDIRKATVGGLILVGDVLHYLTSGHVFLKKFESPTDENDQFINGADIVAPREGVPAQHIARPWKYKDYGDPTQNVGMEGDWALLKPTPKNLSDLKYLVNHTSSLETNVYVENYRDVSDACEPVLLQQGGRDLARIACSQALSLIPSADGRAMNFGHKVWRSSVPGESGSWIIDSVSGDLLGILTAVSMADEISYMLRAPDVFNCLSSCKAKTVRLPRADHFKKSNDALVLLLKSLMELDQPDLIRKFLLQMEVSERAQLLESRWGRKLIAKGAEMRSVVLVRLILEMESTDPRWMAKQMSSELETACLKGSEAAVWTLLEAGADPKEGGCLCIAVFSNSKDVVKLLLEAGAIGSPDAFYAWEETVSRRHYEMVPMFLAAGVEKLDQGLSAAMRRADEAGDDRMRFLLIQAGADLSSLKSLMYLPPESGKKEVLQHPNPYATKMGMNASKSGPQTIHKNTGDEEATGRTKIQEQAFDEEDTEVY
ncbi:hypothetical protein PV08_08092 [Exophiala spinifera]|uniref:Uncharacterized protein n=1 Tax=Exophiala spinifera TaxID=91928 RepID=A0A0D2B2R7_9EURO|nr:uncharacterized protein PV08_08092 [Exophiala spinifera]KIW12905.1 hypothetical protein PV08_08092 [Exophiala spinifera]